MLIVTLSSSEIINHHDSIDDDVDAEADDKATHN